MRMTGKHGRAIACGAIAAAAMAAILMIAGCSQSGGDDESGSSSIETTSPAIATGGGIDVGQDAEELGELVQARYGNSGNSSGNLYYIETDIDEDGTPIVREADSPSHDVRATIREYRAPEDLIARINAIADDAGMKDWGELPLSDMVPLDASTPTITLTYTSADPDDDFPIWLSYTAWDVFPEGGEETFNAIRNELISCIVEDNLIREYDEPDFER